MVAVTLCRKITSSSPGNLKGLCTTRYPGLKGSYILVPAVTQCEAVVDASPVATLKRSRKRHGSQLMESAAACTRCMQYEIRPPWILVGRVR